MIEKEEDKVLQEVEAELKAEMDNINPSFLLFLVTLYRC